MFATSCEDLPQSCPSYTEASILEQAVPFIIFLSKQSTAEDELASADAEGLESKLEALHNRLCAQNSLISNLDIRLKDVRTRQEKASRSRHPLAISRLVTRSSAQSGAELEEQHAQLRSKRREVEHAVAATKAEVQSVKDSIAARHDLRAKRYKQQTKLDRIYERVFVVEKHEHEDERAARAAITTAEASAAASSARKQQIKLAYELLGKALFHSSLALRSLHFANQSRLQSGMLPSPPPGLYTATIRRAVTHETSLRVFLQQSLDIDPDRASRASIRAPWLSLKLGSLLDAEAAASFPTSIWSAGTELFRRVNEAIDATQCTAQTLAHEHRTLARRFCAEERQCELAGHQVGAARDRLRNIRRRIFIDTLLCHETSKHDLFAAAEDPYTLLAWLKDADEAGRLSEPTSAALAQAVEQAAGEDLPDYGSC